MQKLHEYLVESADYIFKDYRKCLMPRTASYIAWYGYDLVTKALTVEEPFTSNWIQTLTYSNR